MLGFLMYMSMSGYQMKQQMSYSTSNFMDASFGSIYPALKRLESKALVTGEEVVEGGKFIRRYSITEPGRAAFLEWLKVPAEVARVSTDHLVKLFFYVHLDDATRREHYLHYIKGAEAELSKLREIRAQAEPYADDCQMATLTGGLEYYEFLKGFYERLLAAPAKVIQPKEGPCQ